MSNSKYTPDTPKVQMPKRMTAKEVAQLDAGEFYPSYFYNSVMEIARSNVALKDFEDGIIKPDEVKFMGRFIPFKKRTVGCKVRMLIRGRELKRVYSDGRQVNRFALDLERLAS